MLLGRFVERSRYGAIIRLRPRGRQTHGTRMKRAERNIRLFDPTKHCRRRRQNDQNAQLHAVQMGGVKGRIVSVEPNPPSA